jgi:hypothetical protein
MAAGGSPEILAVEIRDPQRHLAQLVSRGRRATALVPTVKVVAVTNSLKAIIVEMLDRLGRNAATSMSVVGEWPSIPTARSHDSGQNRSPWR